MNKMQMPINTKYVLDDGIGGVALIDHMGSDASVVNSARVSFGKRIEQIEERDKKLINYLVKHNHGTPFEATTLQFLVKAPIFVARQWFRHRISSFNEISARYVEVSEELYIPKELRTQSKSNRQASSDDVVNHNDQLIEILKDQCVSAFKIYNFLLQNGVCREQARMVLPLNTYTQFYWTCNLRSLMHFITLRDHEDAQPEIRVYAKAILELVQKHFPVTSKAMVE